MDREGNCKVWGWEIFKEIVLEALASTVPSGEINLIVLKKPKRDFPAAWQPTHGLIVMEFYPKPQELPFPFQHKEPLSSSYQFAI